MRQLLLVAALLVALFNTVLSVGSAAVMDEALAAHNAIRRQVAQAESQRLGGTVSIPDLAWDPALSALAQDWANQVVGPYPPPHRPADQRPGIGENTFWSYSIGAPVNQSVAAAMQFWAGEQQYYDYDTNSCAGGSGLRPLHPGRLEHHHARRLWQRALERGWCRVRGLGLQLLASGQPDHQWGGATPVQRLCRSCTRTLSGLCDIPSDLVVDWWASDG